MRTIEAVFAGAGTQDLYVSGNFFFLLSAVSDIDVEFMTADGGEAAEHAASMPEGAWAEVPGQGFGMLRIASPAAQTVRVIISRGRAGLNRMSGNVAVSNLPANQGAFTQAQKTVTNASGSLLAAKSNRRYLLIQNNDASGDIFVTLDGTAASTAKGIKIAAGGAYECLGYCPSGEIRAIGSIASNANVVTVEG